MKKLVLMLLMTLMASTPSWADKKLTVKQLGDMLNEMQQQKKTDAEVANELKQVELTEQLDRVAMNNLAGAVPGQLSTEQIYVLEAKSAMLPPPTTDIPSKPAPDAAAQTAILNKVFDYASKTYSTLPNLTAKRTTLRFQDDLQALSGGSGMHGSAKDVSVSPSTGADNSYVRYINSTETPVQLQAGAEKPSSEKDTTQWGANGMIALQEPAPSLGKVIAEAQATGNITFTRWQTLDGKTLAVFSYEADKKKTHMAVNICCFPQVSQAGMVQFTSASTAGLSGGSGGAKGNFQTNTQWEIFKKTYPFHGEFFVDPDTGTVLRLITMVDFKNSDYVHQLDERIDYLPMQVGDKILVLPAQSVIQTEVDPQGDSGAGGHSSRHTFFTAQYKDYAAQ